MPWPRTEWVISPAEIAAAPADSVLVGSGPAFLTFEAAFGSFFYEQPPSNYAGQGSVWRINQLDLRGRLHRIVISSDAVTVAAKGTQLAGTVIELSSPAGTKVRSVGRTGRVSFRLPSGLADGSLLVLRTEKDWPGLPLLLLACSWASARSDRGLGTAGRRDDHLGGWRRRAARGVQARASSVTPGKQCSRPLPHSRPGRAARWSSVLLTMFSRSGSTLPMSTKCKLAVGSMIRDSITPEPPCQLRTAELDGHVFLLAEVRAGGRWFAYNPARPEFYVRRGASTVPARIDETAAGFKPELNGRRRI